jgi:hypothetical protein
LVFRIKGSPYVYQKALMQAAVRVREKTLRITYWPLNNLIIWDFDQPLQLYEVSALALKNKNKTRGSKRKKASA